MKNSNKVHHYSKQYVFFYVLFHLHGHEDYKYIFFTLLFLNYKKLEKGRFPGRMKIFKSPWCFFFHTIRPPTAIFIKYDMNIWPNFAKIYVNIWKNKAKIYEIYENIWFSEKICRRCNTSNTFKISKIMVDLLNLKCFDGILCKIKSKFTTFIIFKNTHVECSELT